MTTGEKIPTGIIDAHGKMIHDGDTVTYGVYRGAVSFWEQRHFWTVTVESHPDDPPELCSGWTMLTSRWAVTE